jgi:nifR3 family TIM-barrel protein
MGADQPAAASLTIGRVVVAPPLVLAPMSGVTSLPLRLLCREHGAGLVCSEFVSSCGLYHANARTRDFLRFDPAERPVSCQLFGADPETLAVAARLVEEAGADVLDLNLGCSVPKVVKTGAGACLLRTPSLVARIVARLVASVSLPVTVKIRLGWDQQTRNAVEVARICADTGAAMVTVHGRTAAQAYRGVADWDAIGEVKAAVAIPVVGNGDVRTPADVGRLLAVTGCDGVMIGRAAQGNPWVFARAAEYLRTGVAPPEPSADERLATALRHGELMVAHRGSARGAREMRKHLAWYAHGLPGASAFRAAVNGVDTWPAMAELVAAFRARLTAGE